MLSGFAPVTSHSVPHRLNFSIRHQRCCPVRPNELRMFALSRFSRRFISVKKVLRILAFKSSVRCSPLVATRANRSPLSVINRMISRCRSCGAFPSAVSRRISAQLPSIDRVKCKTQTCCCSARAGGESFLHPVTLHGIAMERGTWANKKGNHSLRRKSSLLPLNGANPA
jgi:hypothetical protein